MEDTEVLVRPSGEKKHRTRKKLLFSQIREQMEFYFSDSNLSKDRFLRKEIDNSEDGYVDLAVFKNFNKMRAITTDLSFIAKALKKSNLLVVNEDGTRVKRVKELADPIDVDDRTIYVECLPKTVDHEWMKKTFSRYGKVMYVSLPKYKTTGDFKGFGFVEFESKEEAQRACSALGEQPLSSQEKIGHFPKTSKQLRQLHKQLHKQETDKGDDSENKGRKSKRQSSECSADGIENECPPVSKSCKTDSSDIPDQGNSSVSLTQISEKTKESTSLTEGQKKRKRKHTDDENESSIEPDSKPKKPKSLDSDSDSHKETKPCLKKEKVTEKTQTKIASVKEGHSRKRKADEESGDSVTEPKHVRISDKVDVQKVTERKKKRRQKRKKAKFEGELPALRVISKKEWLLLKREYLALQKQNMKALKKSLKQHQELEQIASHRKKGLHNQTSSVDQEEAKSEKKRTIEYNPGVIVKFTTSEPITRKEFKSRLSDVSMVAYVDLLEGGHTEGHARCSDAAGAQRLAEMSLQDVHFTLLEGEAERMYWDKINSDRERKLGSKKKSRKKGTQKIVEKGERLAAALSRNQHIVFDE